MRTVPLTRANTNGSPYVPIEALQALTEEQKATSKQHVSELLGCVEPRRTAFKKLKKYTTEDSNL